MNLITQICFHPTPRQRYVWSWIQASVALALAMASAFLIHRGRYIAGGIDAFLCVWNAFLGWVNQVVYFDWKRRNPNR